MLIPPEFDITMSEERAIRFRQRMKKAKHLAERVRLLVAEIDKDKVLTANQKNEIKVLLFLNRK